MQLNFYIVKIYKVTFYTVKICTVQNSYSSKFIRFKIYAGQNLYGSKFIQFNIYTVNLYTGQFYNVTKASSDEFLTSWLASEAQFLFS
jgi:hypothetical protein